MFVSYFLFISNIFPSNELVGQAQALRPYAFRYSLFVIR